MRTFFWDPLTRSIALHEPHRSPRIIGYAPHARFWAEGVANTILLHCVKAREAAQWWPAFAREVIAFKSEKMPWRITFGTTEAGEIDIWLAGQRQQTNAA